MNLPSCVRFNNGKWKARALLLVMSRINSRVLSCGVFGRSRFLGLVIASCSLSVMFGCSGSNSLTTPGAGGSGNDVGGSDSAGGAATGGSTSASPGGGAPAMGGAPATGGSKAGGTTSPQPTGGSPATGGAAAGGNNPATGGRATGGAGVGGAGVGGAATGGSMPGATGGRPNGGAAAGGAPNGGRSPTGGTNSPGGAAATGGSTPSNGGAYVGTKTPGTAQTGDITVDPTKQHQVVDGFGLADVWQGSSSTQMQTLLWDPVNGIGLNLLRVGIDGTSGSPNIMGAAGYADGQACVKFSGSDCKVWAAPWSPPAGDKDNNNVNNGGHLNTSAYDSWSSILAAFPAFYKKNGGVDLYAISAQNEPDFVASYQSCIFNASQMVAWIDVLGPKLAALSPPVKVLAAEPDNWGNIWGGDGYGPAIIADTNANNYVGPIATHDYGGTSAGTYVDARLLPRTTLTMFGRQSARRATRVP